jgi:hypothetical protein
MTRAQMDKLYKRAMDTNEAGADVVINYVSRTKVLDIWVYSMNPKEAFGYAFRTDQPLNAVQYERVMQEMEKIVRENNDKKTSGRSI